MPTVLIQVKAYIVFALSILALGSLQCSPAVLPLDPVKVDFDSHVDFKRYRTFDWNNPPRTSPTPRPAWVEKEIQTEVERVLTEKGFVKDFSGRADLLVAYDIAVEDQMIHQPIVGAGGGVRVIMFQVRRGALLVCFLEPITKRVVWSGLTGGEVTAQPQPEVARPRLREAVDMVLAKFPPV